MDAIMNLGMEAANAGVMVENGGLLPTAMGGRIRLSGGRLTVLDGPFSEAKEVIGGYAVCDLPSKAEAMVWARNSWRSIANIGRAGRARPRCDKSSGPSDFPG